MHVSCCTFVLLLEKTSFLMSPFPFPQIQMHVRNLCAGVSSMVSPMVVSFSLVIECFGPDVMQSGFGVNFLFWSGEFWENCRRISQRILMANFSALFFQGFRSPQKIHAQNSRQELSAFLSNFTLLKPKFIHGDFLLTGETKMFTCNYSGIARVRLADLNGPKWTSSGQNGPKWTILVHFGLANAKIQCGIRWFWPKWSKRPFWTILV